MFRRGDGVPYLGIRQSFDGSGQESHFSRFQRFFLFQSQRAQIADFHDFVLCPGGHHTNGLPFFQGAFLHADIHNDPFVGIIHRIENQRLGRRKRIAFGCRHTTNDRIQHRLDIQSGFGGNAGSFIGGNTHNFFYFMPCFIHIGSGKVHFVDHGNDLQPRIECQISIGKGLRLNALGSIHHQQSTFTGRQGTGYLIIEVYVPRCVN